MNQPEPEKLEAGELVQDDAPRIPVLDWEAKDGKLVRIVVGPGTRRPIFEELLRVAREQGCEVVEATEEEAEKLVAADADKRVRQAAHLALGYGMGSKKFSQVARDIAPLRGPNRAERRAMAKARRKGTR